MQLIPKKLTWSGAVKLINSQVSFLCCLSLNAILIKPWCVLPTPARLYTDWPKNGGADSGFNGMKCIHRVWLPSCVSIQLPGDKLQNFPLPYQVFRQFASQKMGNINQFKPTDLFGPKEELWGTAQEPFCEMFCYVWNHTDGISSWKQTGFSACVLDGHLHPCSIAQMFNGLC